MDNGVNNKGDGTTDDDDNNGDGATDDNVDEDGDGNGATDDDGDGDCAMDDDDNREEMTPPHTTINLSDEEKGGLSYKGKGGGRLLWTQIFKGGTVTPPTRRRSGRLRRRRRGRGRRSRRPFPMAARE